MSDDGSVPGSIKRQVEALGGGSEARLAVLLGRRLYLAVGLLFLLALVLKFFEPISQVLLIAFVGSILGIAFNALIVRLPVGRKTGMAIVGVATLGLIGLGFWFGVTLIAREVQSLVADIPSITTLLENAEEWIDETIGLEVDLSGEQVEQFLGDALLGGFAILGGALGLLELIAMVLLVLMGAFFVVAKPNEQLLNPLLRAIPRERRPAYRRMFEKLGTRLSGWLVGTLVSMVVIGVLSTIAFLIIGVPYAVLLGVLNGLLSIIPLLGAWIGGAVAVLIVLFYNPTLVIWVIVAMIVIQELEGNVIRPVVMSSSAQVHPFVTLLALLLFGSMFGILGAILSLPIVLLLGTIVEVLWVEETIDAGDDRIEPLVED